MVPEMAVLLNCVIQETYVNVKQCWTLSSFCPYRENSEARPSCPARELQMLLLKDSSSQEDNTNCLICEPQSMILFIYSKKTYSIGLLSVWLTSGMQLPLSQSCSCSEISTYTVKVSSPGWTKSPADSHVLWDKRTVIYLTPWACPYSYALILSILTLKAGLLLINTKFIFVWQHSSPQA